MRASKPNIIVLGLGHSGTTIVTKMLHTMGWHKCDADEVFSESVSIRAVNIEFHEDKAKEALSFLPQPWAIKDPRFVYTLNLWAPLVLEYDPVLFWIQRDIDKVLDSHLKRGTDMTIEKLQKSWAQAETVYGMWNMRKFSLKLEDISIATKLFDPNRP